MNLGGITISQVHDHPSSRIIGHPGHMTKKHGSKDRLNTYVSPPIKKRGAERPPTSNKVPKVGKEREMLKGPELCEFLEHWAQRACPFSLVDDDVIIGAKQVTDFQGKVHNLNRLVLKRLRGAPPLCHDHG